jgi:hypothetical protein
MRSRRSSVFILTAAFLVALICGQSSPAAADPATHLVVIFPCCPVAPGGCRISATHPGESRCIDFAPLDANDIFDPTWSGTVMFTSSDPEAVLPEPCTFAASGGTCSGFADVVFRTLGLHTLTVSDASGGLVPGTANITVLAETNQIPAVQWQGRTAAIVLLGLTGVALLARKAV